MFRSVKCFECQIQCHTITHSFTLTPTQSHTHTHIHTCTLTHTHTHTPFLAHSSNTHTICHTSLTLFLYLIIIMQSRFRGYNARKNFSPSSSLTLFDPSKIAKNNSNANQGTPGKTPTFMSIFESFSRFVSVVPFNLLFSSFSYL